MKRVAPWVLAGLLVLMGGAPEEPDDEEERGGVDLALPLTPESLMTVADRMRPSIAACVEAWTAESLALRGEGVLGFQLDGEGVAEAWVVEQDAVPPAVLGCFSAAVYEQGWPAAPDGVEVTFPFTVEAGLVDDPAVGPPTNPPGGIVSDALSPGAALHPAMVLLGRRPD